MDKILSILYNDNVGFVIRESHWNKIRKSKNIQHFIALSDGKPVRMVFVPKGFAQCNDKMFRTIESIEPTFLFDVDISYAWQVIGLQVQIYYQTTNVAVTNVKEDRFVGDYPYETDYVSNFDIPTTQLFIYQKMDQSKLVEAAIKNHLENRLMAKKDTLVGGTDFRKCLLKLEPMEADA